MFKIKAKLIASIVADGRDGVGDFFMSVKWGRSINLVDLF